MTVAAPKTKAEQALTRNFEAVAAKLPGGRAVADARKAAIGAFAALGLPHRRIEEWKYTDLRVALKEALPPAVGAPAQVTGAEIDAALGALAGLDAHRVVFVDGVHAPQLSSAAGLDEVTIQPLAAALAGPADRTGTGLFGEGAARQEAVVALNTAFMTDGAVVGIDARAKPTKSLLLIFVRAGAEGRLVTTRNVLKLAAGARATIIEAHVSLAGAGPAQANTLTEVTLADGAHLAPCQGHARRRGGKPSGHGDGDARGRGHLLVLPIDRRHPARAQHHVRRFPGRGRQARRFRRCSSAAGRSTSTRRWSSIMPYPLARAASSSRACSPTAPAACSRAR